MQSTTWIRDRVVRWGSDALLAGCGGAFGIGLLAGPGRFGIACLALTAAFGWMRRPAARPGFARATARAILFAIAAGVAASPWLPDALEGLGIGRDDALLGWGIAVAWAAVPHLAPIVLLVHTTRRLPFSLALAAVAGGTVLWEGLWLRLPGAVPLTLLGGPAIEVSGLAQCAAAFDATIVSGALAALALSITALPQREPAACAVLAAVVVAAAIGTEWSVAWDRLRGANGATADPALQVLAIQPDLPRTERFRPALQATLAQRVVAFTRRALAERALVPDATPTTSPWVVWPENLFIDFPSTPRRARSRAMRTAQDLGVPLLLGITERKPLPSVADHPFVNAVLAIPQADAAPAVTIKARAVPIVEAALGPIGHVVTRRIEGADSWVRVSEGREIAPADPESPFVIGLCFEILFPWIVEARRPDAARLITNLADDSWTNDPRATRQLTQLARYRAIEARLPLLRVAHGGRTAFFDAYGRERARLPLDQWGALSLALPARRRPDLLDRASVLVPPLLAGLVVSRLASRRRSARRAARGRRA